MKRGLLVFVFYLLAALLLGAQEKVLPQLAVVEFSSNVNTEKAGADRLTVRNLVESQMVSTGKYQVISRAEIDRLLKNQQIQVSAISSTENIRKLQLQNISYIVTGSVDAIDASYAITVKILDVSTGRFSYSADAFMGGDASGLYDGVRSLVSAFVTGIDSSDIAAAQKAAQAAAQQARVSAASNAEIGIKVTTNLAGTLFFQGEEMAALWDNDEYLIPVSRPGNYTVKMRFGNGAEVSRSIVITSRGIVEVKLGIPPVPQNVRAGKPGSASVPLSWDRAGEGLSYKVYYNSENNAGTARVYGGAVSGTASVVFNLEYNRTYYFWVSATEGALEGEKSAAISQTIKGTPPVPQNVRVGRVDATSVSLSWNRAAGE